MQEYGDRVAFSVLEGCEWIPCARQRRRSGHEDSEGRGFAGWTGKMEGRGVSVAPALG